MIKIHVGMVEFATFFQYGSISHFDGVDLRVGLSTLKKKKFLKTQMTPYSSSNILWEGKGIVLK